MSEVRCQKSEGYRLRAWGRGRRAAGIPKSVPIAIGIRNPKISINPVKDIPNNYNSSRNNAKEDKNQFQFQHFAEDNHFGK